jgi:hypothetical protein
MKTQENKEAPEILCYGPNEESFCTMPKSKLRAPEFNLFNLNNDRL